MLFQQAEHTGLLRSSFTPLIRLAMITQTCQSYLAYLPLYQVMLPAEDVSSQRALSRAGAPCDIHRCRDALTGLANWKTTAKPAVSFLFVIINLTKGGTKNASVTVESIE